MKDRIPWEHHFVVWIRSKKAILNHINEEDDECFQYAVSVALNHEVLEGLDEQINSNGGQQQNIGIINTIRYTEQTIKH